MRHPWCSTVPDQWFTTSSTSSHVQGVRSAPTDTVGASASAMPPMTRPEHEERVVWDRVVSSSCGFLRRAHSAPPRTHWGVAQRKSPHGEAHDPSMAITPVGHDYMP